MNICFFSNCQFNEFTGGIDRVSSILIREFIKLGHNISCCYINKGIIDIHDLGAQYQLPNEQVSSLENIDFIRDILISNHIDIIINDTYSCEFANIIYKAQQNTSAKLINVQHTDPEIAIKSKIDNFAEISFSTKKRISKISRQLLFICKSLIGIPLRSATINKLNRVSSDKVDAKVFLSKGFKDRIEKRIGSRNNFFYISNPLDLKQFETADTNPIPKEKIVLFVGRFDFQKRVDRMLRIWRNIEKERDDWKLVIIGDGTYLKRMKDYAKELGLKNYSFEGGVSSMPYYKKASIVCITSTHEGFSMVLTEAQANACATMAFDSYATVRDIIENGKSGMLIRPFHEKEYANKLLYLMENDEMRIKMGINGKTSVVKFEASKIANQWISLFNHFLQ